MSRDLGTQAPSWGARSQQALRAGSSGGHLCPWALPHQEAFLLGAGAPANPEELHPHPSRPLKFLVCLLARPSTRARASWVGRHHLEPGVRGAGLGSTAVGLRIWASIFLGSWPGNRGHREPRYISLMGRRKVIRGTPGQDTHTHVQTHMCAGLPVATQHLSSTGAAGSWLRLSPQGLALLDGAAE